MSAKIIDLSAARARAPITGARFTIREDGSLTIRAAREDGSFDVPAFVVPVEHVDDLLRRLSLKRRQQRDAAASKRAPEAPKEKIALCMQRRDGGHRRHRDGCRRHDGHPGRCRDKFGDYTPAICCHIGFPRGHVTTPEGSHLICGHCGTTVRW